MHAFIVIEISAEDSLLVVVDIVDVVEVRSEEMVFWAEDVAEDVVDVVKDAVDDAVDVV